MGRQHSSTRTPVTVGVNPGFVVTQRIPIVRRGRRRRRRREDEAEEEEEPDRRTLGNTNRLLFMGKRDRARKRKADRRKLNKRQFRPSSSKKKDKKSYDPLESIDSRQKKEFSGQAKSQSKIKEENKTCIAKILVVGDGDFSFSRGLIRSRPRRDGSSIVCTSYDTADVISRKYSNAAMIITEIKRYKVTTKHIMMVQDEKRLSCMESIAESSTPWFYIMLV
eukprot:jgi/Bigna1/82108/fgenesh1_pg.88_\